MEPISSNSHNIAAALIVFYNADFMIETKRNKEHTAVVFLQQKLKSSFE